MAWEISRGLLCKAVGGGCMQAGINCKQASLFTRLAGWTGFRNPSERSSEKGVRFRSRLSVYASVHLAITLLGAVKRSGSSLWSWTSGAAAAASMACGTPQIVGALGYLSP